MKICSKCKVEKSIAEFSKDKHKSDGKCSHCKTCNSLNGRLYYEENTDKVSAKTRARRAANPGKFAAISKKYYENNKEKSFARSYAWSKANPEKRCALQKSWSKANPEKSAAFSRNRRASYRAAEGKHTAADVRSIFDKQCGLCANCGVKLIKSGGKKYHVDHIMPLALGGSNWPYNLQCLCPTCNLRKSAKHPADWAKQQGKLL